MSSVSQFDKNSSSRFELDCGCSFLALEVFVNCSYSSSSNNFFLSKLNSTSITTLVYQHAIKAPELLFLL